MTVAEPAVEPIQPATGRRPSAWVRFIVAFLLSLIVGVAGGAGAIYAYDRGHDGHVLPGVRVGGVDLSGLDRSAAEAHLADALAGYGLGELVLATPAGERTIPYAAVGRRADSAAMVDAALAVGRDGSLLDRAVAGARTALRGVDLGPRVTYDPALLAAAIDLAVRDLERTTLSAAVRKGADGFVFLEGRYGLTVDRAAIVAAIGDRLGRPDAPDRIRVPVTLRTVTPVISDAEAQLARIAAERMAQDLVLADGEESWTITAETVRGWLGFAATSDGRIEPTLDRAMITAELASLAAGIDRPPMDATYLVGKEGEIVGVTPGRTGRSLDVDATVERVAAALGARAAGAGAVPVEPALVTAVPELTTEEAQQTAPLMRRISEWTTWFPYGIKNNYGANIWLPAEFIDGTVLAPGETFDFWKAVGPVTRERGFGLGGAIINGRTEPQGALAGGICSNSTTIFNAALRAGLQMGARRNHFYYIDRYPLGLDATVFISGSGSVQTMTFTNDTPYPILIRGSGWRRGSKGYVKYELFSVPTGRTVEFSDPIVKNVRRATTVTMESDELRPGARERVEFPVDGKDVWVTRTVSDAGGTIIHQETYYSHYARITGIILVGRTSSGGATAAPTPSPAPSPAPSP